MSTQHQRSSRREGYRASPADQAGAHHLTTSNARRGWTLAGGEAQTMELPTRNRRPFLPWAPSAFWQDAAAASVAFSVLRVFAAETLGTNAPGAHSSARDPLAPDRPHGRPHAQGGPRCAPAFACGAGRLRGACMPLRPCLMPANSPSMQAICCALSGRVGLCAACHGTHAKAAVHETGPQKCTGSKMGASGFYGI